MVKIILIILNRLVENEKLVQRLADSYPMRRAAQFVVYLYNKNKFKALEQIEARNFKDMAQWGGLKLREELKKIVEELQKRSKQLK